MWPFVTIPLGNVLKASACQNYHHHLFFGTWSTSISLNLLIGSFLNPRLYSIIYLIFLIITFLQRNLFSYRLSRHQNKHLQFNFEINSSQNNSLPCLQGRTFSKTSKDHKHSEWIITYMISLLNVFWLQLFRNNGNECFRFSSNCQHNLQRSRLAIYSTTDQHW